ncbi:cytochrome b/b6 domain-containing protein [Thalassotalea psychrophila]|uniref:Cytochrome b/b6 domain-containing protein n=1 Tax=Thalassotalea psychrophila TaxID=3065647 RepID=A0ABY9TWD7_9GAMM|nr:cytochrome b/b6 domain-containing protein [Colwelliaceae bacterium SQ149]
MPSISLNTRVWDNFTRVYHFSQLILLILLWYTGENAEFEWHFICGFTLAGLWITRLIWGFIGSDTSKFSHFIRTPFDVLKAWKSNSISQPHNGHNPVGGYMVMLLLLCLGLQLFTGLFASDDVFTEGPLYMMVSEPFTESMDSLHHQTFDVLLVLIGLHALAGILHMFRGDNVIAAIITGKKLMGKNTTQQSSESLLFKSAVMPLIVWGLISYSLYYWGMGA